MKSRPANRKSGRQLEASSRTPNAAPPISPARQWLFRFAAALLLPALVLGVLEGALRVAGFGYDPAFFQKLRIGGRDFLVNNDAFSSRFFPPAVRRFPNALRFATPKPPGAYRIFVLGESAVMGDPAPAFGVSRYLEVLLRERFPEQRFEVVNVAFTAINSHVILPIARECAGQQGDLWVVYMGNNEMVGPFGAATVFGAQAPPLGVVRLNLALQKTRLGQLLVALGRKLLSDPHAAPSWRGMEMFLENQLRPDDPRKESVYRNFQENLEDIVRAGLGSGAKLILNTVAVNLKDCPPFASLGNTNLSTADRAAWARLYTNAVTAQAAGNWHAASRDFAEAATLDPHAAELQYRWGQCSLALTNVAGAREQFQAACDDDALSFRATSRINDTIRRLGTRTDFQNLVLCDAAAILATNSPARICGDESFYEHVHFKFDGSYRLARIWAAQIEQLLAATTHNRGTPDWASQEVCERRLGLTDWNRCFVIQSVLRRLHELPLSSQPNNGQRLATFAAQETQLRARMTPNQAGIAREVLDDALKRAPDDHPLLENLADLLDATGDTQGAAAQWKRIHELLPHDYLAEFQQGRLLGKQGQLAEAETLLKRAVMLRPSLTEGWFELGNLHAMQGRFDQALSAYERASQSRPQDPMLDSCVAKSLVRLDRRAEGIERYRRAIQRRPDYWEARYELGGELTQAARIAEARTEYEQVVRIKPDLALGHFNLGVILARQGHLDEARREFEETLRLQPDNKSAETYLRQVRALKAAKP